MPVCMESSPQRRALRRSRPARIRHWMRIHEALLSRRTFGIAASLAESQFWSAERLRSLQLAKLRRLLNHASAYCPYYRDQALPIAGDVRRFEDLRSLPLIDRDDLRMHARRMSWHAMRGKKMPDCTRGTTDVPVPYYWDRNRQAWDKANRLRGHAWHGFDVGDRELHFWPYDPPVNVAGHFKQWVRDRRDALFAESQIDSLAASGHRVPWVWRAWGGFNPSRVTAYPAALAQLVRDGLRVGCRLDRAALDCVFLTGEVTFAWQRRLIEQSLGTKVVQNYGLQEAGALGYACERGSWHVSSESAVVEIIRDGRPAAQGELGEVVVTGLESLAMPLVRYCTGDIVRAGAADCSCELGLPVMPPVLGRAADFLEATSGHWVEPARVVETLGEVLDNGSFQVSQDDRGALEVRVASPPEVVRAVADAVSERMRHLLGERARCEVVTTAQLARTLYGKCRYVHSDRTRRGLAKTV